MRHHTPCLSAALLFFAGAVFFLTQGCGDDPLEPGDAQRGRKLVLSRCTFCHFVEGQGGMIAPPLEKGISLASQLVRDYEKRIETLKQTYPKAYADARPAIDAVLAEKDPTKRFELWLSTYLRDTKFDNPMTKMGHVNLSDQERLDVIAWVLTKRPAQ